MCMFELLGGVGLGLEWGCFGGPKNENIVGYSGEASSDVHRVADLVATRLASKYLEYARTSTSIAKAMQTQRICRAWGHSIARGSARVILDRLGTTWIRRPALAIGEASWTLALSSTSSTRPRLEEAVLNGLFPLNNPPFPAPVILLS
jgi:hypothetical protein